MTAKSLLDIIRNNRRKKVKEIVDHVKALDADVEAMEDDDYMELERYLIDSVSSIIETKKILHLLLDMNLDMHKPEKIVQRIADGFYNR